MGGQIDLSQLSTTVSADVLSAVVTALVNVNNLVVAAAGNPDALSQLSSAVTVITSQLAAVVADPSKLQAFKACAVPPPPHTLTPRNRDEPIAFALLRCHH